MSFVEFDYIEDYAEQAIERMPSRYRGKERIEALYRAISSGTQMLEDLIFDVIISSLLDNATGFMLDNWGRLLAINRDGFDDPTYRRFIKAGILIRISDGRPDELVKIYRKLTEAYAIRWYRHKRRGFRLEAYRPEYMSDAAARKVKRLFSRAKPGSMSLSLVEVITDPELSGTGNEISRTL